MSFKINKIYTDNPYVDEMVYYTKLLAADTVLKLKDRADKAETAESLKAGDLYVSCIEGTAIIEVFPTIPTSVFLMAGVTDTATTKGYRENTKIIPAETRKRITDILISNYINEYEELNPYYRMLHGLPPIGEADYIEDWLPPDGVQLQIYDENGEPRPIHTFDANEIAILEQYGVIDDIIETNPEKYEYMRHLGSKAIDYYLARRANRFDVLYVPEVESEAIHQMYRDKIDDNKFYVLRTIYSEAFKYNSDHYDNMIAVFIVLITMIDIISRVQEFITRKEIFDIRSVQYIFQSNGIPFFGEIPLKYQVSMVKNLHTLLKYKSTAKCMVDICSIFGFDNVKIFKYYLLKDRKTELDGSYKYAYNEDGTENLEEEYELKFIKLPLDEDLDSYIRDQTSQYDYDEITLQDPTWDGGKAHDEVIASILKEEFNLARTKYMSIDSITDIAKSSIQQNYFFNMLYDNVALENMVVVQVPYIATGRSFNVADLFTLLTALTYKYNGFVDQIVETDASNVLYVNGFNFKADLAKLAQSITNSRLMQADKDAALGLVNKYNMPTVSIPSFKEMMNLYVNNLEVRDELVQGMLDADNKEIYDIYKNLYDSLMISELTYDYYKNPETGEYYKETLTIDGETREYITYTEFLRHRDLDLYAIIGEIDNFEDETAREQYIATVIDSIVYALEEFIDTIEFQALFSNIPAMSADAAKQYIVSTINFYKSYKVDFLGINTIYTIDDKLEAAIKLIDKIDFTRLFDKEERIELRESLNELKITSSPEDRVALMERIYFDIYTFVEKYYPDKIFEKDDAAELIVNTIMKSIIVINDIFTDSDMTTTYYETIAMSDTLSHLISINPKERLGIHDRVWIYKEGMVEALRNPYMTYVSGEDVNKIIVADETGDAKASVYISSVVFPDSDDTKIVTEEAVAIYSDAVSINKDQLTNKMDTESASDNEVLTEEALIDALTIITSKDLPD